MVATIDRSAPESVFDGTTPFVGREQDLATLRTAANTAARGNGVVVIVSGEAGIGKTRLATAASPPGLQVLHIRGVEDTWQPPLENWAEILDALLRRLDPPPSPPSWCGWLVSTVPRIRAAYPDLPDATLGCSPQEAEFRIARAIIDSMLVVLRDRPTMLILDDVHSWDPASLRVLGMLAPRIGELPLLLVPIVPAERMLQSAELADAIARLQRGDRVHHLALAGLDRAETATLVAPASGPPLNEATLDLVHRATGGNPMLALAFARHLLETVPGTRDPDGDAPALDHLALPEALHLIVRRRLRPLPEDAVLLARHAAICMQPFDDIAIAAMTGFDEPRLLDAIDAVLAAHIVRRVPGQPDYFCYTHDLMRAILADTISPSRRPRLERTLAHELIARDQRRPHPYTARIARAFHRSALLPGDEEGIPYALDAADIYRRQVEPALVVEFCRMARDMARHQPPAERARILRTLVIAEADAFELDAALETAYAALSAMVDANAPVLDRAAFIADVVTLLHDNGMNPDAWMPLLNLGLDLVGEDDPETWARLTLLVDRFDVIVQGPINGARWLGSNPKAVAIARESGNERLYSRSMQPWEMNSRELTLALSQRVRTWHDPIAIIRGFTVTVGGWLYLHGDFRQAHADLEALHEISAHHASVYGLAESTVRLAIVNLAFGNLSEAHRFAGDAARYVALLGRKHRLHASHMWITALTAEYEGGDWNPIATWLQHLVGDPDLARGTIALDDAALAALALVRSGRIDEATLILNHLVATLERVPPDLWLLNGTVAFAGTAVWDLADQRLAARLLRPTRAVIAAGYGDFPCSSMHLTVARLCTLLGDRAGATTAFAEARTVLDQSGQVPLRAIVELDEAIALADHWRQPLPDAIDRATHAAARFRDLGMTVWEERANAHIARWQAAQKHAGSSSLLSPRELEVLRLVVRGRSDRQVSDEMFVSPRTVHAHIRNMLAKTGTANRTELSIWAVEHGVVGGTANV
jgi:DNA-binding CsgD family transcriptional regulator